MNVTRRYWEVVGLALALLGAAVLFDRPFLLAGGALLGAWLVARQYTFVRAIVAVDETLSVTQSNSQSAIMADDETVLTLEAELDKPSPLVVTVTAAPPVGAHLDSNGPPSVRLSELTRAFSSVHVAWPTVGSFTFGPATITARDRFGFFTEDLRTDPGPTITVEPRRPRSLHVGAGGQQLASAYGDHPTSRGGSGLTPAEIREYVTGDTARRIDWKTTARLGTPYVREFEAETNRVTLLVVDHRSSMATGQPGETKHDLVREVALSVLASTRQFRDPIGLYAVGDDGLTIHRSPDTGLDHYTQLRTALLGVSPSEHPSRPSESGTGDEMASASVMAPAIPPARSRRIEHRLAGEESPFATRLRPYLATHDRYLERIERDPLFSVVRLATGSRSEARLTVVLTDDTNRTELGEAVKLARRGNGSVVCFLAPHVLYEPGGLSDLTDAYGRYVGFESFRRSLDRLDRVSAYEVAPGDRLAAVLATGRTQREATP